MSSAEEAGLTIEEIRRLPATIDVVTAGRALGLGRTKSYELAKRGQFPCRVLTLGRTYRVPTAELLRLLGLAATEPRAAGSGGANAVSHRDRLPPPGEAPPTPGGGGQ